MTTTEHHELAERLQNRKYHRGECLAALRGQQIPNTLGLKLLQFCTIRGIRYHSGFGKQLRGLLPEFTRALNARSIMSNMAPDISSADEEPYCIWHPEVASESTYRDLVLRYPSMRYQVGRACAVAGYTELYRELDILPEVHIAEEARDGGSKHIFEHIMAQPVKYKVMDDYERTIHAEAPVIADINGDTAVRWMLDVKQKFFDIPDEDRFSDWDIADTCCPDGYHEQMFNVTEDMNVDECYQSSGDIEKLRPPCDTIALLVEPLPRDLSTADKDILIRTAAYYGDIERYVRLRRPHMVEMEFECAMRGVYHNTLFAVWWSKQPLPLDNKLRQAIEARYIMNNVLSRVTEEGFAPPYLIWYPTFAKPTTYRKLAELRQDMLPQILRACIVASPKSFQYKELFDELLPTAMPDEAVLKEARLSGDVHFAQALNVRIAEAGLIKFPWTQEWKNDTQHDLQGSSNCVHKYTSRFGPGSGSRQKLYNGSHCSADDLELTACLPDVWKIASDDECFWRELDYIEWPIQALSATISS